MDSFLGMVYTIKIPMSMNHERFNSDYDAAERIGKFSRRTLFIGGAALAGVYADMAVADHLQQERSRVQVAEISDDETREKFPHDLWLVLPGFKMGWDDSRRIAESLSPSMRERGRIAYAGYSNKGLHLPEIKREVDTFLECEDIKRLFIYGHSFGGMVGSEIAHHIQNETDVDCNIGLLDSSPSSVRDVRQKLQIETLALLDRLNIPIPTCGRAMFEGGERITNKDERSWGEVYHQTAAELVPGAPSSRLIRTEGAYIHDFDIREFPLSSDTNICMLANIEDETVNISSAISHWSSELKKAFRDVLWTNGAQPAHASPFWNPKIYNTLVLQYENKYMPTHRRPYKRYY